MIETPVFFTVRESYVLQANHLGYTFSLFTKLTSKLLAQIVINITKAIF